MKIIIISLYAAWSAVRKEKVAANLDLEKQSKKSPFLFDAIK
jgi:hypothetical protein